jgi:hypothetical protein
MAKTMTGGFFNLRYGRPPGTVKSEVTRLLKKHDMDFLDVCEAADYFKVLREIKDYKYFATNAYRGGTESGILVHRDHKATDPVYGSYGDGWVTLRGGKHSPVTFPRVTIDGWLRSGSIHMPTPTTWVNGRLHAPPEREDDYLVSAHRIRRYLSINDGLTRQVAGDWNEPPTTMGEWSPGWIAKNTGSKLDYPKSFKGHGHIDYTITRRGEVHRIWKDLDIAEGSDHEPGVFMVSRG